MAYIEAWVRFAGPHCVLFPKDMGDFDGYMIAKFVVCEIVSGPRNRPGSELVIKVCHPLAFCAASLHLFASRARPSP